MAEEMQMMNSEEEFNRYFKRIKEEVQKNLNRRWEAKKYASSASWLLTRFAMNQDPEFAEEAATYILAATFMKRGKK